MKVNKLGLNALNVYSLVFFGALATLVGFSCTNSQAKNKINIVNKDAPKAGVAVKIKGVEISDDDLVSDVKSEIYELEKKKYELKMDQVNRKVEEVYFSEEAKKASMPLPEFMEKKVFGKISVSDSEYNKFVKDNKIPEEQIKERPEYKGKILEFIEAQKKQEKAKEFLAKLTKNEPIEVYFKKPEVARVTIDTEGAAVQGKKDAPVQIVTFSDFQCPYCSRGAESMDKVVEKNGKKVALYFKHFPLSFHPHATPASEIALCVKKEKGDSGFWKFHDLVFKNQSDMANDKLLAHAKTAGADQAKVKECFEKGEFKEAVQKDIQQGAKLGVKSTPSFFINGQLVAGALPPEQFQEIIDEELSNKK